MTYSEYDSDEIDFSEILDDDQLDPELKEFLDEESEEKPKRKYATGKREKSDPSKQGNFYITNDVLLPEVKRSKELGRITNELAKMLLLIAERYSFKHRFVGYSYRDDMVSFALLNLMANALKFDPEKSNNPFAFYTTAIHRSFLQYLADERKHRDIRDSLIVEEGFNPSSTYSDSFKDDGSNSQQDY